jgi:hypothetical protein
VTAKQQFWCLLFATGGEEFSGAVVLGLEFEQQLYAPDLIFKYENLNFLFTDMLCSVSYSEWDHKRKASWYTVLSDWKLTSIPLFVRPVLLL